MKKRYFLILLSILLTLACLLASCNANKPIFPEDTTGDPPIDYAASIQALENQIIALQQNQYISDIERQEEILRLQNLLAELKGEVSQSPSDSEEDSQSPTEAPTAGKFLYSFEGTSATITGYTGNEETLVIPSSIDGYTVSEISDSAFSSTQVKRVIISGGVTKIGWFAFQNCPSLVSITIPSSVTSIGYSAFSNAEKNFTIYCPSNSFAEQYAKSYGIPYTII